MRFPVRFTLLLVAAFAIGHAVAKNPPPPLADTLTKRHDVLMKDLQKIRMAAKHIVDIQETRRKGFELSDYEAKMERDGRKDFHIFMERYRNDTLETLTIIERALGVEKFVDPLYAVFGKSLKDRVEINWSDKNLEDVVDEFQANYKVEIEIEGDFDEGHTIEFEGQMTLLSALLQVENLFDVRMRIEGKKLIYVVPERDLE